MKHITVTLPVGQDELQLYPVADVQYGAHGVEVEGFREYIAEVADNPTARIVGVGDYTDGISPSNRKLLLAAFVKGELYDVARDMLDNAARQQVAEFIELVDGTAGKWDAVLGGHHFWEYQPSKGMIRTTDHDVADAMDAPYVEAGSAAIITYVFPKSGSTPKSYLRVWVTHGQGGSASFSGPLNSLEKMMRGFAADVFIVAHHHKLVAARAVKLESAPKAPTGLRATDGLLVAAGSWMRGYMPDETTYAERGMMVPLATGAPVIDVVRRDDGTFRVRGII